MLDKLPAGDEQRLVDAMTTIERLLEAKTDRAEVTLRAHRPGDMGWVVQQHGLLYAREFGSNISFEGMVAGIVAQFLKDFDPDSERCWIAEMAGEFVGSVFLVRKSPAVSKLRLLIIHPKARGQGLGRRLTRACIAFARRVGYRKMVLWTQSHLAPARAIYEAEGFRRVSSEKHRSFGKRLVAEVWQLRL